MQPDRAERFWRAVRCNVERQLAEEAAAAQTARATVLAQVRGVTQQLVAAGHVRRAWLFGSMAGGAWGEPDDWSDVDVLAEPGEKPLSREALADAYGQVVRRPVHALWLGKAPPTLVERVLREGIALWAEPGEREAGDAPR